MELALIAIGGIFSLVSFAASLFILVDAFKASVGEGFLCLCVPCYILYYGFSKFDHPKKGLIIAAWIGCSIVGQVLIRVGGAMAEPSYGGGYGY